MLEPTASNSPAECYPHHSHPSICGKISTSIKLLQAQWVMHSSHCLSVGQITRDKWKSGILFWLKDSGLKAAILLHTHTEISSVKKARHVCAKGLRCVLPWSTRLEAEKQKSRLKVQPWGLVITLTERCNSHIEFFQLFLSNWEWINIMGDISFLSYCLA